jgi:hypothetical protein
MIFDEQWPAARLIPISSASGVEAQERRLASALLAVMQAVPEFGRVLLKPLGAPAGRIESFIEVPLKLGDRTVRPDGILTVARGSSTWGALVETKTAANPVEPVQMNTYLDLARELEFNAVLSISNQYVSSSTEYPVEIDRRKLRRVSLHHWSWTDVLTEAIVQAEHRGVSDPDQAYILNELIRYLSDPRSGAVSFEGMGPAWTAVRDGAREGTIRRGDPAAATVAARWDDLVRYLALSLTSALGRPVRQTLPPEERSPAARRQAVIDGLAATGQLNAALAIPDVAGPLSLVADLRSRQIVASTELEAPREGTSKGRVSWLLRQLQKAPENLIVEARVTRRSPTIASPLRAVREDPTIVYPEKGKEIRSFRLTLTGNMGLKRASGQGSFSDSVVVLAERYYEEVLQNLRVWKASPPKLKRPSEKGPEAAEMVAEMIGVESDAVANEALPEEGVGTRTEEPDVGGSGLEDASAMSTHPREDGAGE